MPDYWRAKHAEAWSPSRRWWTAAASLFSLALGVFLVGFSVDVLPEDLAAARGEGVQGTFTAEEIFCSRSGCSWDGSFVSDDGFTIFTEAWIDADAPPDEPGDVVRALWTGDEHGYVYTAGGSSQWLFTVFILVVGGGAVGFALVTVFAGWSWRRS